MARSICSCEGLSALQIRHYRTCSGGTVEAYGSKNSSCSPGESRSILSGTPALLAFSREAGKAMFMSSLKARSIMLSKLAIRSSYSETSCLCSMARACSCSSIAALICCLMSFCLACDKLPFAISYMMVPAVFPTSASSTGTGMAICPMMDESALIALSRQMISLFLRISRFHNGSLHDRGIFPHSGWSRE